MIDDRETLVRAAVAIVAAEKGIREDCEREEYWSFPRRRHQGNYLARAKSAIEAFKVSYGA